MSSCAELAVKLQEAKKGETINLDDMEVAILMAICKDHIHNSNIDSVMASIFITSNNITCEYRPRAYIRTNTSFEAFIIERNNIKFFFAGKDTNYYLDEVDSLINILIGV